MKSTLFLSSLLFFFCGCSTNQLQNQRLKKNTAKLAYNDSTLISKRNGGIDFIASGNEPTVWTLEMDYDNKFLFTTQDGISISCPPSTGVINSKNDAEIYQAKGVQGEMEISIFADRCSNDKSRNTTTVFTKNILFKGCGQHLYNEQLNDKWILQEIDDEFPDLGDFPNGLPMITLDLVKKQMTGFDGCNSISSGIKIQGDRIQFYKMISTLKACEGVKTERLKLHLISSQLVEYRFRNKELILYLMDDSRLIFKPAL
jgi:heat shock protein HslJ